MFYKTERKCHFIDIELKEQEEVDNYSELSREVKKIWNLSQVVVAPVVTGVLGVTWKTLKDWLQKLDVKSSIALLQQAVLLRTAKVIIVAMCNLLSRKYIGTTN